DDEHGFGLSSERRQRAAAVQDASARQRTIHLLMPALSKAKGKAQRVGCMSNLRQWILCFYLYGGDNNDSMPMGWNNPADYGGVKGMWMSALRSYYANPRIRLCPNAVKFRDTCGFPGCVGDGGGFEGALEAEVASAV